jgi:hypothetical protein
MVAIQMKKRIKYAVISIGIVAILVSIGIIALNRFFLPKIPKPQSDVPIEYKIGWWDYQDILNVKAINIRIVYDALNLFNHMAVVEYKINGSIKYKPGMWRPYVKEVNVNELWLRPQGDEKFLGQIELTPIISLMKVSKYNGEEIEFDLRVQDYLQTGGWGKNRYIAKSQHQTCEFEIWQEKWIIMHRERRGLTEIRTTGSGRDKKWISNRIAEKQPWKAGLAVIFSLVLCV